MECLPLQPQNLQPQPGQSVALYNLLVREDSLVTIRKTIICCKEVAVPDTVASAAPAIHTEANVATAVARDRQ